MPLIADLPLWLQATLRLYPWRRLDPVPCTIPRSPLREASVAIVTSAGFVPSGAASFDEGARGGDWSYRVIPGDTDLTTLTESHRSQTFDHAGIDADANLALPLDRLREMAVDGAIGRVAPRHLSFMGSITAPGRLVKHSAPEAVRLLVEDGVDLALLVPV